MEVINLSDYDGFDVAKYYQKTGELLRLFQNEDFPCVHCPLCVKEEFHLNRISWVTINTSDYCNSCCIYCRTHFGQKGNAYDPLPIIRAFDEEALFDEKCLFDWGGGEPTQNPFFAKTVEYLMNRGFYQRINTNAIEFSQATYDALKQGNANLRISIDSGSGKCFERVKGHQYYDETWENLRKYCSVSSNIDVKYNVLNLNSDTEEIDIFLDKCKSAGVRNVHIDAEIRSYQPLKNAGPFYFTIKEFEAAHYLESRGKQLGFNIVISPYAFSSRAEYDGGKLALPSRYFDNIDHEVLSRGIMLTAYANIETFRKEILTDCQYLIVGKGIHVELVGYLLETMNVDHIILENEDELRDCYEKGINGKVIFVLFNDGWEETLRTINSMNAEVKGVAWLLGRSVTMYFNNIIINYPIPEVKNCSRIALYGYGNVGKAYYEQIKNDKEKTVVYIVDQNYQSNNADDFSIRRIEEIKESDFDCIIVAVAKKIVFEEIRNALVNRGIPKSKIVYNYKRHGIRKNG